MVPVAVDSDNYLIKNTFKVSGLVDRLTAQQRSALMGRIRGKDTHPEMFVRRMAHGLGYRYRLHRKDLPGSPDLVFPGRKKVIFVHGCFWHRHPGCPLAATPKTRPEFWRAKFATNVKRDREAIAALRRAGWDTMVVWECETKNPRKLERRLVRYLEQQ